MSILEIFFCFYFWHEKRNTILKIHIYFIVFKKGIPTGLCNIKHMATQGLEKPWPSGVNIGNNTDGISHM